MGRTIMVKSTDWAPGEQEEYLESQNDFLLEELEKNERKVEAQEKQLEFMVKVINVMSKHIDETPAFLADMDAIGALHKPTTKKDK